MAPLSTLCESPLKTYETLTPRGRLRRLRRVAEAALQRYDLDVLRFELVARATNRIYRVRTSDGRSYALRLAQPGWRTLSDLESEALWLEAIARDTDIPAPRIVRALDGDSVVVCAVDGVPTPRHATLMSWLPGALLGRHLDEPNLEKLGELFGQLHIHGARWKPPTGFTTRTFDQIFARGEPDVVFDPAQAEAHTPDSLRVMRRMREVVDAAYAALDPADLRVIHSDLWHDNVKLHGGVLHPFDFEDTVWGYRLYDIAMAMLDLYEAGDANRYEDLLAAFRRGYERQLDWPEGEMAVLQIGRILWRVNWVARFQRPHLANNLAFNTMLFERYLKTGKLLT